eukprot:540066_1
MSLNCSLVENKIMNSNNSNSLRIELNEDFVPIYDIQFWTFSFWIGLLVITFIIILISCILSFIYFPRYDLKQKEIKLKEMDIQPVLKHNISSYLHPYTKYNQHINNIIFSYANIPNHIDSIITSTLTKKCLCHIFVCYLFMGLLLIASYIQIYMVIVHWNDSYLSYLNTECNMIDINRMSDIRYQNPKNRHKEYNYNTRTIIHLHKLIESCDDILNANEYVFEISSIYGNYDWHTEGQKDCYIHKDSLNVRQQPGGCCCCDEALSRCGRDCLCKCCIKGRCGGCANACGYFWCLCGGLVEIICWRLCLLIVNEDEIKRRYKIQVKYDYLRYTYNAECEYLL